jgi:hypothetical protein
MAGEATAAALSTCKGRPTVWAARHRGKRHGRSAPHAQADNLRTLTAVTDRPAQRAESAIRRHAASEIKPRTVTGMVCTSRATPADLYPA